MDTVEQHRRMPWVDAGLLGVAVLAGAALVAAAGHYWPIGRSGLLVEAAAMLVLLSAGLGWALRPDFEHARPQFEQIAADLRASPERSYAHDLRIGRFDVDLAYDTSTGEVYFHDARRWPLPHSSPGWVYSPDRAPRGIDRLDLESIGDGWYRFDRVTVD